jgi:hypothetical protein
MKIKYFILIGAIVVNLICQSFFAFAALDTAIAQGIATALSGKTVSDIINEVRLSGVSLIDQAKHSANAMISRGGNEANVLAKNLDIIFKDDMNLTFDRLGEERKAILIEAEALRRNLSSLTDTAYSFKDSAVLDLNDIVTSLPFTKKNFFIQSIKGLSYLPQAGDFKLQVAATTLGIQERINTNIEVFKGHENDNKPLKNIIVDQSKQRFIADIYIPNKELSAHVNENNLTIFPLTIRFNVSRKKGWWIFSTQDEQTYDVPVFLNLFPRKAATIISITKRPTYGWVNIGQKSDSYSTPNRHCSKHCKGEPTRGGNRIEFAVPGGPAPYKVGYKRLMNPIQKCVGGNCGYSDSFNLSLTNNNTRLVFTWDTWSTPGTWKATADVQEYRIIGETTDTTAKIDAYFGKILEILIPKDTTTGILKIQTFTKQKYEIILGAADPNGIITYQGKSIAGPDKSRVTYRVNNPTAVAKSIF